jgi:chemotaxis protein methyltransferase WspC
VRPVKVRKPLRPLSARKELKIPELAAASPAEGAPIEEARRLADLGRLSEAIRCCETVVDRQPGSAEAYHLMGVLEDAAGDRRRAAECYRRAIYLDPEHVEALTHLALLVDCEGDRNAAERFRERARRVAERNL